jgi:hypothetical protein
VVILLFYLPQSTYLLMQFNAWVFIIALQIYPVGRGVGSGERSAYTAPQLTPVHAACLKNSKFI